jgi:Fe-S cluster assembly ATPase SufC
MTLKKQESDVPSNDNNGPNEDGEKEAVIAVMGITGAGKSYFIQKMTGDQDVVVGDSQMSCKLTTLRSGSHFD